MADVIWFVIAVIVVALVLFAYGYLRRRLFSHLRSREEVPRARGEEERMNEGESIEVRKVQALEDIALWFSVIAVINVIWFILGLMALLYIVFFFKFPSP